MGKKKKKHIQTEKERRFQEEAARKRKEKAEAKRLKSIKDARWLIGFACIVIAVSFGFTVWTAARMHNFETNYITMSGTITDYNIHHHSSTSTGSRTSYTLVISYTYNGADYTFNDTGGYHYRPTDMIGTKTEIYVNPEKPEKARRVSTASTPSYVSAMVFAFGAVIYVLGTILLLQEKGNSFVKRLLCIWLPIFLWCIANVLLFWIGLPHDGFGAIFSRVKGAIGYAVVCGIPLLAVLIDAIITKKKKPS